LLLNRTSHEYKTADAAPRSGLYYVQTALRVKVAAEPDTAFFHFRTDRNRGNCNDPQAEIRETRPVFAREIDPKTGKRRNLGTFDTRRAAEKHEREIQYFKRQSS
jgi:hypothetical protein